MLDAYISVDVYYPSMIQTATVMTVKLTSTLKRHALPTTAHNPLHGWHDRSRYRVFATWQR